MTIAEELGPLAMGSLFKAVARNAEVVEQEVDFMSKTKSMAKLAIESKLLCLARTFCALVEALARSAISHLPWSSGNTTRKILFHKTKEEMVFQERKNKTNRTEKIPRVRKCTARSSTNVVDSTTSPPP